MAFVKQDQVEEILRQATQPAIFFALQLVHVGDGHVGHFQVAAVGGVATDLDGLWEGGSQNLTFEVEHVGIGWVEVFG